MPTKHLFVIHGRATKPPRRAKQRLVRQALVAGLERVDPRAARAIERSRVKFTLAYYGDVNNELMIRAEPGRKESMVRRNGKWFERPGSYDADLERLLARPTRNHTKRDYRKLIREVPDRRLLDDLARIVSPVASLTGLGSYAIKKLLPDLGAYLTSRLWGSEIRTRLQGPLKRALARGDDVALVAHSMGCIVSYDVLWKLSRMSEYRSVHDRKISLLLTLGSPLGEPAVKDALYDSHEPDDGRYPTNIVDWINIAAHDDFVAHDGTIADDFREMRHRRLVERLKDHRRIYTFWVGTAGSNPHKLYGYLNHPTVAQVIAGWIG